MYNSFCGCRECIAWGKPAYSGVTGKCTRAIVSDARKVNSERVAIQKTVTKPVEATQIIIIITLQSQGTQKVSKTKGTIVSPPMVLPNGFKQVPNVWWAFFAVTTDVRPCHMEQMCAKVSGLVLNPLPTARLVASQGGNREHLRGC